MTNGLHDQPSDRPEGLSEADDRALDAMLQAFFERESQTAPHVAISPKPSSVNLPAAHRSVLKDWENPQK